MRLNDIKPGAGARRAKKRVGRGIGSGHGKTSARGHKGQKARSGGFHKVGFEGGQMPLQRRLPKRGFTSMTARETEQVRLSTINRMAADEIDLAALQAAGAVSRHARTVKVILAGTLERVVRIKGLLVTKGARAAIEAAGGSISE